jgi:hypothetical protein
MTCEQRGVHAGLLFAAWLEVNCGIPEKEICLSARINEDTKPIAFQVLSWCWFLYNGFWFCERLLNERIKQINVAEKRKVAGSKGGRPVKSRVSGNKPIAKQLDNKAKAKETKSEEEEEEEKEKENTTELVIKTGKKKKPETAFEINGQKISWSFWQSVLNRCQGDRETAGRIFFRAKHRSKNIISWISGGLLSQDKYVFKTIREEDADPAGCRKWIDDVINRYKD